MELDPLNVRILDLLQQDGRRTFTGIAEELERAESTVRDRIDRLLEGGVIERYTVVLDPDMLGLTGRALVRARAPEDRLQGAFDGLLSVPEVTAVHHTSGQRNLAASVTASDVADLERVLRKVAASADLRRTNSDVVLRTVAGKRPPPMPALLEAGNADQEKTG